MAGYHYPHSGELPTAMLSRRDSTSTISSTDSHVPEVLLARLTSLKTDQKDMKERYNVEKDKLERERLRRRINLLDDDIVCIENELSDAREGDTETDDLAPLNDTSEEKLQAGAVTDTSKSTNVEKMDLGEVCKEARRIFQLQAALIKAGLPRSPEEERRLEQLLKILEGGNGVDDRHENRDLPAEPSTSKRELEKEERNRIINQVVQEMLDKQEAEGIRIKQRRQLEKELAIQTKRRLDSLGYGSVSPEKLPPDRSAVRQHPRQMKQTPGKRTPETRFREGSTDSYESDASSINSDRARRRRGRSEFRGKRVDVSQHELFVDYSQRRADSPQRIFVKINCEEVEVETLEYFGLPFCMHEDDPNHYVIEEWVSESRQRQIFEHTAALRKRRALEAEEKERRRLSVYGSRVKDAETAARLQKKKKKEAQYIYRWA